MAEISKQGFESSWSIHQEKMGLPDQEEVVEEQSQSKTERPDSFVLDMESLSPLTATASTDSESFTNPRFPLLQKTLTRKSSQKSDRAAAVVAAVVAGSNGDSLSRGNAPDKAVTVVLSPGTPETVASYRRSNGRRPSSRWLDPRRILLLFATLSSMGTIILLYFTLSMGKMDGGDADAR